MRFFLLVIGACSFAVLVFVTGVWYGQPFLVRQFVMRRLDRPRFAMRLLSKMPKWRRSAAIQSDLLQQLSALSELLDATARNLRLGKSMASALQAATETCATNNSVIGELVTSTTRGESFADAVKRLLPAAKKSELVFTLRTIDLAATGGVGGVLALERAAIVLRERLTNVADRQMQAAQAMLSTKVLSWAPVVVAGWLILTSSSARNFLILSLSGWLCILLGFSFNYAGRRWMQTIVAPSAA